MAQGVGGVNLAAELDGAWRRGRRGGRSRGSGFGGVRDLRAELSRRLAVVGASGSAGNRGGGAPALTPGVRRHDSVWLLGLGRRRDGMRGRRDAGPIKGGRRGSWGCAPWRAWRDLRRENRVSLAQWRGEGDEAARWGRWVSGALHLCGVERRSLAGLDRLSGRWAEQRGGEAGPVWAVGPRCAGLRLWGFWAPFLFLLLFYF